MSILRKFRNNQSGNVAVTFSLAVLPLMALTYVAVDYSQHTKQRNAISTALDAAVLAAANNNAVEITEKGEYAKSHFLANYSGDIPLELTSSVTPERVRLVATGTQHMTLGNIIGIQDIEIVEASAATLNTENTICVLSLSDDADGAISFDHDLSFTATNCSVHSNSSSSSAILSMTRIAKSSAASFCAVGGTMGQVEPHSKGECTPVADPYEMVAPAEIGVCKSEFLFEYIDDKGNPAKRDGGTNDRNTAPGQNVDLEYYYGTPVDLPISNPISVEDLLEEFDDDDYDYSDEDQFEIDVARLRSLTGPQLRELLEYYDKIGPLSLTCRDFAVPPLCYSVNNPYLDSNGQKAEARDIAADIFNLSFGSYFQPQSSLPDIVENGIAELINGQLYSRNNIDNELVPISANLTGANIVLTPGTYCGGLTVDGIRVQFMPGDYVFKDGPLTFMNESQADADKVTFGFTGEGATLNIESGSTLDIRSAITGPRKGLAFMQMIDRSLPGNRPPIDGVNRIASGGSVSMSGTAYFPQQKLMLSGEDTRLGASSPAVGLIADRIEFRGNFGSQVAIGVDHVKAGIPPIQPRADDGVRLIE